ncbi:MAG: hypothetical protein ACM34K_21505 [Bacillota bacterium]
MTSEEIKGRIIKYCPSFIKTNNDIFVALISAVANALAPLSEEVKNLNNSVFTGKPLKLLCNEIRIFFSGSDTDEVIQQRYSKQFEILTKRGTEPGIEQDLKDLLGNSFVSVEFSDYQTSGIIEGVTFIGVDDEAVEDGKKLVILTTNKNISYYKPVIEKYIVPIDALIIYKSI